MPERKEQSDDIGSGQKLFLMHTRFGIYTYMYLHFYNTLPCLHTFWCAIPTSFHFYTFSQLQVDPNIRRMFLLTILELGTALTV